MTIIEALRSGKPFHRKSYPGTYNMSELNNYKNFLFNVEHILATDWEVKEGEMELKPLGCPFCGRIPVIGSEPNPEKHWKLFCDNEDCPVNVETVKFYFTKSEAIAAWNRRVSADAELSNSNESVMRLQDERDALKKQIAERDLALVELRKEMVDGERTAFKAGQVSVCAITKIKYDFDEWKRGQK